jgi:hypothetical protein
VDRTRIICASIPALLTGALLVASCGPGPGSSSGTAMAMDCETQAQNAYDECVKANDCPTSDPECCGLGGCCADCQNVGSDPPGFNDTYQECCNKTPNDPACSGAHMPTMPCPQP